MTIYENEYLIEFFKSKNIVLPKYFLLRCRRRKNMKHLEISNKTVNTVIDLPL